MLGQRRRRWPSITPTLMPRVSLHSMVAASIRCYYITYNYHVYATKLSIRNLQIKIVDTKSLGHAALRGKMKSA